MQLVGVELMNELITEYKEYTFPKPTLLKWEIEVKEGFHERICHF